MTKQKIHEQLLRYGRIIKDIEFDKYSLCHRIRIISFAGYLYYDHMINGEVDECLLLGKE